MKFDFDAALPGYRIGLDKKLFLVYKCILKAIFPQNARALI
jgi:hypothetical protein